MTRTSERVFWSGAYEKPVIGDEKGTPRKGEGGIEDRVPGSQRLQTTTRKLVISDAGDMAYDYSDATLTFDLKNGQKFSLKISSVRVWKKEGGQWKVAVQFSAPQDSNRLFILRTPAGQGHAPFSSASSRVHGEILTLERF
ncbi:MAG: DUF4440 domain-containing protein [Acidobacteriota bacterium]